MMMVKDFSADCVPDVALTVKVEVPSTVGVPEIVPDVLNVRPTGRVPLTTDQEAPETLAARVSEYAVPVVPEGRLSVVIVIVGAGVTGFTVMENCFSADSESLTALTVKVDVPVAVGVPVIMPVEELSVRSAGRVPDDTDHVTPEVFAVRAAVYEVLSVAVGRVVVVIAIA